jgi:hypothetical protein
LQLAKWGSRVSVQGSILEQPMSALGQKRTFKRLRLMSALPPKADILHAHIRFCAMNGSGLGVQRFPPGTQDLGHEIIH